MKIIDVYSAKAVALVQTEVASNRKRYIGEGLFPAKKKMGLDLKWIKTSKGLPVSLSPSNFDAVSTLRSREGFKMTETEMAFFRESRIVKETDEQEMLRVQERALAGCTSEGRRKPAEQRCAYACRCSEASRPRRAAQSCRCPFSVFGWFEKT